MKKFSYLLMLLCAVSIGAFSASAQDLAVQGVTIGKYVEKGATVEIRASIFNVGQTNITSFTYNWSLNGGETMSQTVSLTVRACLRATAGTACRTTIALPPTSRAKTRSAFGSAT